MPIMRCQGEAKFGSCIWENTYECIGNCMEYCKGRLAGEIDAAEVDIRI